VADAAPELPGVPVESVPWTEAGEADALRRMDAGLMPLRDDPFSRGKCGFKLLQYAATGIPAVASPVGANTAIVEHGRTGFLAATEGEWEEALRRLAGDPALRARTGAAARRLAEERWSAAVLAPPLARFLSLVAESAPAAARAGGA
jgi:glycosyltransferase involved in cell wall biosynthesis